MDDAFEVAATCRTWRVGAQAHPWHDPRMPAIDRVDLVIRRFPQVRFLHVTLDALSRLPLSLCRPTLVTLRVAGDGAWWTTRHSLKVRALGVTTLILSDMYIAAALPVVQLVTHRVTFLYMWPADHIMDLLE